MVVTLLAHVAARTDTLITLLGNLASVYGSFLWPSSDAPLYHIGFATTTALIAAGGVVVTFIRLKYGNPPRIEELMAQRAVEVERKGDV